jgi:hypothetical protein
MTKCLDKHWAIGLSCTQKYMWHTSQHFSLHYSIKRRYYIDISEEEIESPGNVATARKVPQKHEL